MYIPTHLKRWTLPDSYFGAKWPDYYMGLGQHRDSDSLTRSNFACFLKAIGGESGLGVRVVRENHWAVGWVEWIAIHETATEALEIADSIMEKLDGYPVVNEDHWSDLEWTEAHELWEGMSLNERVEMCQYLGCSVFSARLTSPMPDILYEHLRS